MRRGQLGSMWVNSDWLMTKAIGHPTVASLTRASPALKSFIVLAKKGKTIEKRPTIVSFAGFVGVHVYFYLTLLISIFLLI